MPISKKKIHYLSHGKQVSGGYLHESYLAENLYQALGSDHYDYAELRQWQYFENPKAHLNLFLWAFKNGDAEVNITVARLALPVILRNAFNRKKIVVVWHYYDAYDGKSKFLRRWYHALARLALTIPGNKLSFVCVAPFWQDFFKQYFKLHKVFHFPNFFDPYQFQNIPRVKKEKQIHLGQVSFKNSNELFLIAERLSLQGYSCYFSTNDAEKTYQHKAYSVRYFAKKEDYLREMAASAYTLAMPFFREGWNRIAHESLLVGTQVIGFDKGGLGDLLKGANAFVVGEPEEPIGSGEYYRSGKSSSRNVVAETLEIILTGKQKPIDQNFLRQFDVEQTGYLLLPILDWCRQKSVI